MQRHRGLKRKSGQETFYARRRVPHDLRSLFCDRRELVVSLQTSDRNAALVRLEETWTSWTKAFAEARRRLQAEAATAAAQQSLRRLEADGILGPPVAPDQLDVSSTPSHAAGAFLASLRPSHTDALLMGRLQEIVDVPASPTRIAEFDAAFAAATGLTGSYLDDAAHRALRRDFASAWLRQLQAAELKRLRRLIANAEPQDVTLAPHARTYEPRAGDRTVGEAVVAFRSDREAQGGFRSSKYDHLFRLLLDTLGSETPLRAVTRDDCRRVRRALQTLSPHSAKRRKPAPPAAADVRRETGGVPSLALAPATVRSYLQRLGALFAWAVREGWADTNPALGLAPPSAPPRVARRGFKPDELRTIFGRLNAGPRDWRFWIPALALYTGARLGELCQLARDDVRRDQSVLCLHITSFDARGVRATGKRLKTPASERRVPLRRELVDAGLLELLRGEGGARLFSDAPCGTRDDPSHQISGWFARHLDRCGLSQPSLVFHSFRHGFRDRCEAAGVSPEHQRALCGWAPASLSERYGTSQASVLARELARLDFEGFVLPAHTA